MRRVIRLGIKIKKFIDRTNRRIRNVKRFRKGSLFMYDFVKSITLAEI